MDQIFFIRHMREKKWEYDGTMHEIFIDIMMTYDSMKRKFLYNILLKFGITKKLDSLIKFCLNETYN
jgi:hypothetical protein